MLRGCRCSKATSKGEKDPVAAAAPTPVSASADGNESEEEDIKAEEAATLLLSRAPRRKREKTAYSKPPSDALCEMMSKRHPAVVENGVLHTVELRRNADLTIAAADRSTITDPDTARIIALLRREGPPIPGEKRDWTIHIFYEVHLATENACLGRALLVIWRIWRRHRVSLAGIP
ncbi:hypothetical protein BX666DRAFT_2025417 [Dichotomocladium elegans]|nr:hypothetical protein BX666DRAFT_2025417 [Dichotomocladium elegans]